MIVFTIVCFLQILKQILHYDLCNAEITLGVSHNTLHVILGMINEDKLLFTVGLKLEIAYILTGCNLFVFISVDYCSHGIYDLHDCGKYIQFWYKI